jgi:hypothetical protein
MSPLERLISTALLTRRFKIQTKLVPADCFPRLKGLDSEGEWLWGTTSTKTNVFYFQTVPYNFNITFERHRILRRRELLSAVKANGSVAENPETKYAIVAGEISIIPLVYIYLGISLLVLVFSVYSILTNNGLLISVLLLIISGGLLIATLWRILRDQRELEVSIYQALTQD